MADRTGSEANRPGLAVHDGTFRYWLEINTFPAVRRAGDEGALISADRGAESTLSPFIHRGEADSWGTYDGFIKLARR